MNTNEHTSNPTLNSNQTIAEIATWLSDSYGGYYVTVNATVKDTITFEQQLSKLSHKLNDFCLGRSYQRREKQLNIVACLECGKSNNNLHAHLIITFPDADIRRSFQEINVFIRKHWYTTIGQNNIFGTMVDVRPIGDLHSTVGYSMKETNYLLRNDFLNVVFL